MLALINDTLFSMVPVTSTAPLSTILTENRIQALAGGQPIEYGVRYFVMREDPGLDVQLDRNTGEFTTKGYGMAKLRAVFGSKHIDSELVVQRAA